MRQRPRGAGEGLIYLEEAHEDGVAGPPKALEFPELPLYPSKEKAYFVRLELSATESCSTTR